MNQYMLLLYIFSDSDTNPPMTGSKGKLIPLRNNAAGRMSGFEVILKGLVTEYFPKDKRSKGYNVSINVTSIIVVEQLEKRLNILLRDN